MVFRAFKYRLEPNAHQTREIEITLETHRRLEQRRDEYEPHRHSVKYTYQSRWFKQERQTNPYFARLNFSSAQATMRRLDRAFQAFFRRAKAGETPGYPRFKPRDRFDSCTYPSLGDGVQLTGNKVRLQHIGLVRIHRHRSGKARLRRSRSAARWISGSLCWRVKRRMFGPLGVMAGQQSAWMLGSSRSSRRATASRSRRCSRCNGKLKKLRVAQGRLSRRKGNGQNRRKQRRQVARVHAQVANTRRDLHHKTARDLVDRYGLIAVESLNIQGMSRNHRLARAILDAGWNQFIEILGHKAESAVPESSQ